MNKPLTLESDHFSDEAFAASFDINLSKPLRFHSLIYYTQCCQEKANDYRHKSIYRGEDIIQCIVSKARDRCHAIHCVCCEGSILAVASVYNQISGIEITTAGEMILELLSNRVRGVRKSFMVVVSFLQGKKPYHSSHYECPDGVQQEDPVEDRQRHRYVVSLHDATDCEKECDGIRYAEDEPSSQERLTDNKVEDYVGHAIYRRKCDKNATGNEEREREDCPRAD